MNRRNNPYNKRTNPVKMDAWNAGYEAALHNLDGCEHHPEALTDAAVEAIVNTTRITAHQGGVKAGRQIERDIIGEQLILMAQDYGHAQFVFTADDLEDLTGRTSDLLSRLGRIETLR